MNQIDVRGMIKRFGSLVAVDRLDLTVSPGQVHGFLGPNGAGKSTTLRTLLGLYHADAGSITVLGADPAREASTINRRISYVAGDVVLWPNLTGAEVLDALAGLRGARRPDVEADLIGRFDFDPVGVSGRSGGPHRQHTQDPNSLHHSSRFGTSRSRLPLLLIADTNPERSICSSRRAARVAPALVARSRSVPRCVVGNIASLRWLLGA